MALTGRLLISFAIAAMVVYATNPYAIVVADRLRFYDKPAGYKGHAHPTPYLGGAAVMSGFVLALLLIAGHWGRTVPLVGGVALLWAAGTIDDRLTRPPSVAGSDRVDPGLGWCGLGAGLAPARGSARRSRLTLRERDRVRRHRLLFEVGALGLNPCWIHCR